MSATTIAAANLKAVLSQTRTEWLASAGQHFDKLVIGAAIFRQYGAPSDTRLLIIRRAADEDYYPNCFEMPSGKVDDDETIHQALARELFEETELSVTRVLAQLPEITYTTEKTILKDGKEVHIVKRACQLNFAVTAADPMTFSLTVTLNEKEHSEWKWANVEEMKTLQMTELMRECTENALKWANEHLGAT